MVTELSRLEYLTLRDLTRQSLPVWGGLASPTIERWVRVGLIRQVEEPRLGYVISDEGTAAADHYALSHPELSRSAIPDSSRLSESREPAGDVERAMKEVFLSRHEPVAPDSSQPSESEKPADDPRQELRRSDLAAAGYFGGLFRR
jgi:hypothetical protein